MKQRLILMTQEEFKKYEIQESIKTVQQKALEDGLDPDENRVILKVVNEFEIHYPKAEILEKKLK